MEVVERARERQLMVETDRMDCLRDQLDDRPRRFGHLSCDAALEMIRVLATLRVYPDARVGKSHQAVMAAGVAATSATPRSAPVPLRTGAHTSGAEFATTTCSEISHSPSRSA